jgi:hypothetical protein
MKNLRNFKTFELGTFQKTSNNSKYRFYFTKLFTGINTEIAKLSGDMYILPLSIWQGVYFIAS